MALFSTRRRDDPSDELAELRRSVQNRGQAKIPEATVYIDDYLRGVANEVGVANAEGQAWLRDWLRYYMVVSWASWFNILDRIPEGPDLRREWVQLTRNVQQFGPEHLVAWWWLVSEPLFRPTVDNQLREMRGSLVDGAAEILRTRKRFSREMVNWDELF